MLKEKIFKRMINILLIIIVIFSNVNIYAEKNYAYGMEESLYITSQPVDNYCVVGETANFSVHAEGERVRYRWYYSKDNGITWKKCQYSGYSTNTLSFSVNTYQYNYLFRCEVKDKNGQVIISDEVMLKELEASIVKQPENCISKIGETAKFQVLAKGNGLKYRWYYSKDDGVTWNKCQYGGYSTDTLSFETKAYQYGYQFRCLVRNKQGYSAETETVDLQPQKIKILQQPVSEICGVSATASFSVKAEGYNIKYRWYYSKDNGATWKTCQYDGYRTDCLSFPVKRYQYGYRFRCVITDKLGNSFTTNEAELKPLEIIILNEDNFESIQDKNYNTVADSDSFLKNIQITNNDTVSVSYPLNYDTNESNVVLLRFTAYAENECGKIKVTVDGTEYEGNFVLPVEKTDYILPISGYTNLGNVNISLSTRKQNISVGNFELVDCGNVEIKDLKTGIFNLSENAKESIINESESFGANATDVVTDGKYLYSVNKGKLTVYSLEDVSNPEVVTTLDGLGNCRDIALCKDNKALAISARENGVYFVNISNPEKPVKISNIDTLGLATGIEVKDDYCFISSRNFGTEIYDISELAEPKYCSLVSANEEFYDCCVSDGYLYVSVWAQRKVRIYDLQDIYEPVQVSEVVLSGCGGGCQVSNGILYVATGYHSTDERSLVTSPGYGMGNGIDIFDVSDPENPTWLSGAKIDGKYYYSGFDHWRVTVSGGYAYLTSTYNGSYIFDISNPRRPVRKEKVTVYIDKTSANFVKINQGKYLFTYDTTQFSQGIMTHAAVGNGYVYYGTENTGIYAYPFAEAEYNETPDCELTGTTRKYKYTDVQIPGYAVEQYYYNGTIYSIAEKGNYYYCASGKAGIQVLDRDLNLISSYATKGAVKDVKIYGDYLYTAESDVGMGVYRISGNTVELIEHCTYKAYNTTFSYLSIFEDGNYIAIQAGWTRLVIMNISNKEKPYIEKTISTGTMYYRNLCTGLVSGKYVGAFDRSNITWYSTDSEGNYYQYKKLKNGINAEMNGTVAVGENALAIYNNGYVYYNPETVDQDTLNNLNVYKVPGAKFLKGKLAIDGNTLIATYGYAKQITLIDIADIDNPVLISQFYVEGNPDVAHVSEDCILVPMRHNGILKICKSSN